MGNEEVARRNGLIKAVLAPAEGRRAARYIVGTLFGILLFAAALQATDLVQFHVRMPGYIVLYWFPALMLGRTLSGYRGSGIIVGTMGGALTDVYHPAAEPIIEFAVAALAVEGIMLLAHQRPNIWLAILMGMAASLGKMIPKVALILIVGSTPHHNLTTIPFMLQSYLTFGALAGVIYAGGMYVACKVRSRAPSGK